MKEINFYVISPNVYNDGENHAENMFVQEIAAVGWDKDTPKGKQFKEIAQGDCIIVAQRKNWEWTYYYMGIVTCDEDNPSVGTLSKKLSPIISLDNKDLNFKNWTANGSNQIPSPQRIDINSNTIIVNNIKNIFSMQKYIDLLRSNKNLILTGAPGTGKTYLAKEIAKEILLQKGESHPIGILKKAIDSYKSDNLDDEKELLEDFKKRFPKEDLDKMSLDDYCIGKGDESKDGFCYWIERRLRSLGYYFPGSSSSYLLYWSKDNNEYKMSGYLKKLPEKDPESLMKKLAMDIHTMVNNNNPNEFIKKFGESFILKVLNCYYPDIYAPINSRRHIDNIISLFGIKSNSNNIFDRNKDIYKFYKEQCENKKISPFDFMHILYENFNIKDGEVIGEGGEIKTNGDYKLVQFHPSYDYTDFVEGLRPKQDNNGNVSFERKDGVFKVLCSTALRNPNKKYVIIIDEINRGETSKIFGELFFSIDPGYRGKDGKVKTQYANMQEEPNDFDDALGIKESDNCGWFFVPENVYIIGTMNDIDRSVESMDFAFRRRFAFKEIKAIDRVEMLYDAETGIGEYAEKAKNRMIHLNEEIEKIEGLSSAYHVGPAYFLKLKNYNGDFNQLWEYHLDGLLREYLRGMQNVDDSMGKLKTAYENENPTDGQ